MGQGFVEADYYAFRQMLQKAANAGDRIEPADKKAWAAYIKAKGINEVSFLHHARAKYSNVKGVIIDHGNEWDGFYAYSVDDEACLKWEREGD